MELRFVKALAFEGNQANGQAGSVELKNDRRQGPRGKPAEIGHREVLDRAEVRISVCTGLKIDFDQADARQRARFDVIDAARKRKPALERVGDVGFDLLRWHAGIERGN